MTEIDFHAFLKKYDIQAKEALKEGAVEEIEYSGHTYQVKVKDARYQTGVWSFVQLESNGSLRDCFCSCEEEEGTPFCIHLAIAYLYLFFDHEEPLHVRFERSLWNALCRLFADRIGANPQNLRWRKKEEVYGLTVGGREIFCVKGRTDKIQKWLYTIVEDRPRETEETSLKFSDLPAEELLRWREGIPSLKMQYILSFWNDLAKWMMIQQHEGKEYRIAFEFSKEGLPNGINIFFSELEAYFYLSKANLPIMIPTLATVNSPLKVHSSPQDSITSITYSKEESCLEIHSKLGFTEMQKLTEDLERKGIVIEGWSFVQEDGFYAVDRHHLLDTPRLYGVQIGKVLNEYPRLVQEKLKGCQVYQEVCQVNYRLSFIDQWDLKIAAYLFEPGDLNSPYTRLFEDWVYLEDDGFYPIQGFNFDEVEKVIPEDQVGAFVTTHRAWLNEQKGFGTHLSSFKQQLGFHVTEEGTIRFYHRVTQEDEGDFLHDFGEWLYISEEGFFAKAHPTEFQFLHHGLTIQPSQVPFFIKMGQREVEDLPGFFSDETPIEKSQLRIQLLEDGSIQITPEYLYREGYQSHEVKFFGDYTYVEERGFAHIPYNKQLPTEYHEEVTIGSNEVVEFIKFKLQELLERNVILDPQLQRPEKIKLVLRSVEHDETIGKGWYLVDLVMTTEIGMVSIVDIWKHMHKKMSYFCSPAGLLDLTESRYSWIKSLQKGHVREKEEKILISTPELIRLHALESLIIDEGIGKGLEETRRLLREIEEFHIPEEPDITGLKSTLRPYQQLGVRWLWFLYRHDLSGLLCDDMGLGKTHQAMALMAAIKNLHQKYSIKFLIICPTSVIFHWKEKLQAFLSDFRICVYHGPQRQLRNFEREYDILLTSFGIWRNEVSFLSQLHFELAIFDEVQLAKNVQSLVYASLVKVRSHMRLGMTGTPIENYLRELKALFDIVIPSYMIGDVEYRRFFVRPIEKEGNSERKILLHRLIKPFLLRRTKEQVLLDLPDKTEEILHCVLDTVQKELYLDVLNKNVPTIMQQLQNEVSPIPYVHIFAILSSLKQICNHPAAYLKIPQEYKAYGSGKWNLFKEYLREARESEQKVVVYSQYLAMLDIIEMYLQEEGIGYASIRGGTVKRGEEVERFQKDPVCEVFVGSLMAAGLGIDLTAASVVIHYDRWWNAAREQQATDRVYRIGQTRGVQVFKLVTLGTFEEKIDAMINRKARLMEDIIGADDHRVLKTFDREEIVNLLKYIEVET